MKQALVISGRIPREIADLAEAYHTFHGDTDVKCVRIWYALYGETRIPAWLLTRFANAGGYKYSAIAKIRGSSSTGLYLSEFFSSERAREGGMLAEWQRIVNEMDEED